MEGWEHMDLLGLGGRWMDAQAISVAELCFQAVSVLSNLLSESQCTRLLNRASVVCVPAFSMFVE